MSLSEKVLLLVHNSRSKSMQSSSVKFLPLCDSNLIYKNCKFASKVLIASSLSSSKPSKGLSSSAIALAAASSEIPHLRKQLIKVFSEVYSVPPKATSWQNKYKKKLSYLSNEQYFAFNERIFPWSMGCLTEMVLGGRKIKLNQYKAHPHVEHLE